MADIKANIKSKALKLFAEELVFALMRYRAQTCFHRSGSKLDHASAMRYCQNKHGHFPLLAKTKEDVQAVATKFPEASDIWYVSMS